MSRIRHNVCLFVPCLIIIALVALTSCAKSSDGDAVKADLTRTASADLSEIGSGARLIPVPKDNIIGSVLYAKVAYGNVFFFDETSRCIYVLTAGGECSVFKKLGRGPEEYTDIGAFTFIGPSQEIVIFERSKKKLRFYSMNDFSETRQIDLGYYINAMEYAGGSGFLMFREGRAADGLTSAVIRFNAETAEAEELLELREDQLDLLEDYSLSKSGNDILFGVSGHSMAFYSFKDALSTIGKVSFTPDKLGASYWKGPFSEQKEEELMRALQSDGPGIALAPSSVSCGDGGSYSFWYAVKPGTIAHTQPDKQCCIVRDGKSALYDRISCQALGIHALQPVAAEGRSTYTLLAAEEITPQEGTELGNLYLEMAENGYSNYILIYELL